MLFLLASRLLLADLINCSDTDRIGFSGFAGISGTGTQTVTGNASALYAFFGSITPAGLCTEAASASLETAGPLRPGFLNYNVFGGDLQITVP